MVAWYGYDNPRKKEILLKYRSTVREIEWLEREIQKWRSNAERMTASYHAAPASGGSNRRSKLIRRFMDYQSDLIRSLTSETPGEIGNGFYGTLLPIDFVDGLAGAELEDILIPGKDTESDDSLRERYFNSYDNQAFGGNQSDYKERVSALAGVGGVKVFRTPSGGGTVGLTIVDSEWSVPSSTLIASVQNAVDPLTDQGSGIGFAPIGHTVTVSGVTGRTINTKFKLTLENNVSWPDVQAAVTAAIRGYFQSLIKLWADSEAITVRISQIETRVLAVPGVLDVENTTLNAVGANIQLTGTEIPVLGEVSNGTA